MDTQNRRSHSITRAAPKGQYTTTAALSTHACTQTRSRESSRTPECALRTGSLDPSLGLNSQDTAHTSLTYQALMQWQTRRRVSAKKGIVRRARPTSTVTARPVSLNKEPDTPILLIERVPRSQNGQYGRNRVRQRPDFPSGSNQPRQYHSRRRFKPFYVQ